MRQHPVGWACQAATSSTAVATQIPLLPRAALYVSVLLCGLPCHAWGACMHVTEGPPCRSRLTSPHRQTGSMSEVSGVITTDTGDGLVKQKGA